MRARGIGDYQLAISRDDNFHHRLELTLGTGERIMDLHLHLCTLAWPPQRDRIDVVVIEWLLMQNPRAQFTREKPQLPGQDHPGTGLGRDVLQMLLLLTQRTSRDGLVVVPEKFHLAELYGRGGWRAPHRAVDAEVRAVVSAASSIGFAARAWAVERGCVVDDAGAPYRYQPSERVLAISDRLAAVVAASRASLASTEASGAYRVDRERFAQSLRDAPIPGIAL
ncbi:MAG TPA: hypothetical protein VGO62_13490, partial [Myxococcota bacterium]